MRKYGKIKLAEDRKFWEVTAEPQVIMRIKRVFGKIDRAEHGAISLSNTPENCRDLEWFCLRYPMDTEPAGALKANAEAHRQNAIECEKLFSDNYVPREFELSPEFQQRVYQRQAAELYLKNGFLLLADDVGLGKTANAIMSFTDKRTLPALVVTLTHLTRQWEDEINRFAPALHTHILKKGTPYKLPEFFGRGPDVLICNYHKLSGWADHLARFIKSVVFDEIQELRRTKSLRYAAATHISKSATFALGLSATPIYNYGNEMFNVIDALREDALGTKAEFLREWCKNSYYMDKAKITKPKAFGMYLREHFIMLRRTQREVGRELPDLMKIPYTIASDDWETKEVKDTVTELANIILRRADAEREVRFTAAGQFEMIMRQLTGIAKAPYVADFVRILVESGEKVVLFGWHREVYRIWESKLKDLNPVFYTGTETPAKKQKTFEAFTKGDSQVMFISLRSGLGLDGLQNVCRVVVFGELDWSPAVMEQCIGRVRRDGQENKVAAYYLISETGADPFMAEMLGIKREQAEGIRNPDAPLVEKLERGDKNLKKLAEQYLSGKGKKKARA